MGISFVICCYNSSQRLPETLRHLAAQQVQGMEWEIVLVDNASTDDTVSRAKELWAAYGYRCELRIVSEQRRGVNHARITGINAAAFELIVFCDDDNWLDPDYLQLAAEIMNDTSIGVCGAKGTAIFEKTEPVWFSQYKAVFACSEQADKEGVLDWNNIGLYSAGMVVRKSVISEVLGSGYESIFEARNDNKLSGGEDFEMVVLIRALGYKAYYSPRLSFKHYMPESRMQWSYLTRLVKGMTINTAPAYVYSDTLRYLYTNDARYKVSWLKDTLKAVYGAFLIPLKHPRDFQIVWIKLTGALRSVIAHRSQYSLYEQKIKRLYDLKHKGV